jgi:prepilin-type N-terminal cleavage/methylation domain-containing protein
MKKKAFTLIEFMIVLAIITILTAISFVAISRLLKKIELESEVSNATQGVLLTLNKARLDSVVNQTYVPVFYMIDVLTYDSSDSRDYHLPENVILSATPNLLDVPFTKSATMGFYLGYFVEENVSELNLKNAVYFMVKSKKDEDISNQITIKKGLPVLLED